MKKVNFFKKLVTIVSEHEWFILGLIIGIFFLKSMNEIIIMWMIILFIETSGTLINYLCKKYETDDNEPILIDIADVKMKDNSIEIITIDKKDNFCKFLLKENNLLDALNKQLHNKNGTYSIDCDVVYDEKNKEI